MKLKDFAKRAAVIAAMCGVFFASTGEAGYFVTQWANPGKNPLPMGISQKEATRTASSFQIVGECEKYFDACTAAFVAYYKPQDLQNIHSMSAKDKKQWTDWLAKEGEAKLKLYYAARSKPEAMYGRSVPQPYSDNRQNGGGEYFPFGFCITDGEPAFKKNDRGEIIGMDVDKTKFVGRYEDIVPIAAYTALLYDGRGLLSGTLGGQADTNTLRAVKAIFLDTLNPFIYFENAKGERVLKNEETTILEKYDQNRFDLRKTVQESKEKVLKKGETWDDNVEGRVGAIILRLEKGVLSQPTSAKPKTKNEKLAKCATLEKRLARLRAAGIVEG